MSVTMKCDSCGKEFYSKYYAGGNIDHVENFSRHFHNTKKDVKDMVREIVFNGNEYRNVYDIKDRRECLLMSKYFDDSYKNEVVSQVDEQIEKIIRLDEKYRPLFENLTYAEKKYISHML